MNLIRFRVHHPHGLVEEYASDSSQVLIGSGAHCDVRLLPEEARIEHVLLIATPDGLRATARSLDPPPKLDGIEFTDVPVRGDALLVIDRTRIEISRQDAAIESSGAKGRRWRPGPLAVACAALVVGGSAMTYLSRSTGPAVLTEPAVPALWTREVEPCPRSNAEQAEASGIERFHLALTKRERSPFHPEDGVAAVPLFQSAAACLRLARRDEDAEDVVAMARELQAQLGDQFRTHRLRLQRALAHRRWGVAVRESERLLAFLPSRTGDYVDWLSNLHRRLELTEGAGRNP